MYDKDIAYWFGYLITYWCYAENITGKDISKLYDIKQQEQDSKLAQDRKNQVGSGDRSEKIRTYNFPQGRITDHRVNFSIYQIEDFLNGNLDEMIDVLNAQDMAEKLKSGE